MSVFTEIKFLILMLHKTVKVNLLNRFLTPIENTETNITSTTKKRKERLIVPLEKLSKGS